MEQSPKYNTTSLGEIKGENKDVKKETSKSKSDGFGYLFIAVMFFLGLGFLIGGGLAYTQHDFDERDYKVTAVHWNSVSGSLIPCTSDDNLCSFDIYKTELVNKDVEVGTVLRVVQDKRPDKSVYWKEVGVAISDQQSQAIKWLVLGSVFMFMALCGIFIVISAYIQKKKSNKRLKEKEWTLSV